MPKKKPDVDARMEDIKTAFLADVSDLWDTHIDDALGILKESETKKFAMTFAGHFDFSESTAKLESTMRFSQVHTDSREHTFDDPDAPALPGMEGTKAPKKRGKDTAAGEDKD